MKNKISRNAPCWCDSGLKYKKCHLNREAQNLPSQWDLIKKHKIEFGRKDCLCPEEYPTKCQGKIIKAHTISKSKSLKTIARNQHVYSFLPSIEKFFKNKEENNIIYPELQGINNASTFTGFCEEHDKTLFYDIDNKNFTSEKKQVFLLSYRAISRELFTQIGQLNSISTLRDGDKGLALIDQIHYQREIDKLKIGMEYANNDLVFIKEKLDKILIRKNYSDISGFIIKCKNKPNLLCSGFMFPHYDFQGNLLQNFSDYSERKKSITINIFPSNNKGYIVFSWIREDDDICLQFVESLNLLEPQRITNAIIRFLFEHIENRFANPDWWESLSEDKKNNLNKKSYRSLQIIEKGVDQHSLVEDNIEYDNWLIESSQYL
jgi:hypothetical protein